jgi:peptidoglycan/LPS O-acetylase OafA/YrhL
LRGIGAILVVIAHYISLTELDFGFLSFSFSGVDLFFVLCGFVFAPYLFGKELEIIPYLIRRFFRIYPLYVIALFWYTWIRWGGNYPLEYFLKHLFFMHAAESREIAFSLNPAFWSLPAEVEFYIILPFLRLIAGNIFRVFCLAVLALVIHLSLASLGKPYPEINIYNILSIHLPGLLIEFLLGTIAWRVSHRSFSVSLRYGLMLTGFGLWLALAMLFSKIGDNGINDIPWLKGNLGLFAAFSFSFIVVAWANWIPSPPRWLSNISIFFGNMSYGVYLFHNAMPHMLGQYKKYSSGPIFALLCLLGTVGLAYIFHKAWESPCRRFGRTLANWQQRTH